MDAETTCAINVPEPIRAAALQVAASSDAGTAASVVELAARAASPVPQATPRRVRRDSSSDRAQASRPLTSTQRPVELSRGFLVRLAFEIAEHDRGAILQGQPVDLLVEHLPEFSIVGGRFPEPRLRRPGRAVPVCRAAASPDHPASEP